jgi:hypothetical protein
LVVHADAELAPSLALQGFQLIAWRHPKVLQQASPMQVEKLPPRRSFHGSKPRDILVVEEIRGVLAPEGANHGVMVLRGA